MPPNQYFIHAHRVKYPPDEHIKIQANNTVMFK